VASVHRPELGEGLMALIDYEQKVIGKIVDQTVWRLSWLAAVKMAGVVLNSLAASGLFYHLHIMHCSLPEPVGLDHPKLFKSLVQLRLYGVDRRFQLVLRYDIMPGRIDEEVAHILDSLAGDPVDLRDPLYFISKELNSNDVVEVAGDDIDGLAVDPEASRREV